MADDTRPVALPRLHSYPPEKFPLTMRLFSGKTGEVLWSRTVTLEEARSLATIQIPAYGHTDHVPVRAEITCADDPADPAQKEHARD